MRVSELARRMLGHNDHLAQNRRVRYEVNLDPDDCPVHTSGVGEKPVDNREWLKDVGEVVEIDLVDILVKGKGAHAVFGKLYAGLSHEQYEIVKAHIEMVHQADVLWQSPRYERLTYQITSCLQKESVVIVVWAKSEAERAQAISYVNISPENTETEARELSIIILNDFRRLGIAKQLFDHVFKQASKLGMKKFFVRYEITNNNVRTFLVMIKREYAGRVEVEEDNTGYHDWYATLTIKDPESSDNSLEG